jgi:rod shape-determining protein MreB
MASLTRELGIDLGTMNIVIADTDKVVVDEPTIVAILTDEQKIVELGRTAKDMVGRVPESIEVVRPMRHGVIAEYEITEKLLQYLVKKVSGSMLFFTPRLMMTIPFGVTSVESRAVHEAGLGAGSREVYLIPQPLAAAIGVNLPISTPSGNMIISLGGGTNQVAVIAMHDIIAAETARTGSLVLDDAIITYIRKRFGLIIGQPTAEQLKIRIGTVLPQEQDLSMEIQAQDQVSGLPKPITLTSEDILEALQEPLNDIVALAKRVLEKTPPELISDIIDRGVALCGAGSLLRGMDRFLTKNLGIPAYLVDNPTSCTAEGAVKALGMRTVLRRSLLAG